MARTEIWVDALGSGGSAGHVGGVQSERGSRPQRGRRAENKQGTLTSPAPGRLPQITPRMRWWEKVCRRSAPEATIEILGSDLVQINEPTRFRVGSRTNPFVPVPEAPGLRTAGK